MAYTKGAGAGWNPDLAAATGVPAGAIPKGNGVYQDPKTGDVYETDASGKVYSHSTAAQQASFGNPVGAAVDSAYNAAKGYVGDAMSPLDTSGVQQAAADARNIQNQFMQQYGSLQPGVAPTMQSAQMGTAQAHAAQAALAAQMQAAKLDQTQQDQFRQGQVGLVGNLQDTIAGKTPSLAQMQQQQAFGQLAAQQAGQAAAAGRGGNQALAMRTAMQNQGQLGAQLASQGAMLRAGETSNAQNQLAALLASGRGADINNATTNAGLQQGANQENAGLQQQMALANQANQQAVNQQNAGFSQQSMQQNAQNQQAANAANQQSAINTRGQDITQQNNVGSNANQATSNQVLAQVGSLNAQAQRKQGEGTMLSNGTDFIKNLYSSDRNAKEDIRPAGSDVMRGFLAALHPTTYRYKGTPEWDQKTGIIAQDLERDQVGRSLVRDTPDGKQIHIPSAMGAAMAALADMHRRVDKLEGRRSA